MLFTGLTPNSLWFLLIGLLYFDYVLTSGDEITLIWTQKKTLVSYIFLLNRYLPLATGILLFLGESLSYDDPERTNRGLVAVVFKEPKVKIRLNIGNF